MARSVECSGRRRYEREETLEILVKRSRSDALAGPAHAVYFATYEVVKQAMGGNAAGHHPVAAGTDYS
jgi:hypothetical protein